MQELLAKLVSIVETAGGSITWEAASEQLDFRERSILMDTVRLGRSNGSLKRRLVFNPETKQNTLFLERGEG